VSPDVVSFSAAISACEKGLQWQQALHFLQVQEEAGGMDLVSCNAAISACRKVWQQALNLLAEMPLKKLQADVVSFSAAISSCRWELALHLLLGMPEAQVQPNVVSFNAALANTPGQHTAELLALMARRQVRPSGLSFGAAMGACERSSHWRHALDLLSTAKTFSLLETSLVKAVVRLGSKQRVVGPLGFLQALDDDLCTFEVRGQRGGQTAPDFRCCCGPFCYIATVFLWAGMTFNKASKSAAGIRLPREERQKQVDSVRELFNWNPDRIAAAKYHSPAMAQDGWDLEMQRLVEMQELLRTQLSPRSLKGRGASPGPRSSTPGRAGVGGSRRPRPSSVPYGGRRVHEERRDARASRRCGCGTSMSRPLHCPCRDWRLGRAQHQQLVEEFRDVREMYHFLRG
ncbi:unnamed protein product, partial [Effrenium voratum]